MKNFDIFAQNINCGYSLEPPRIRKRRNQKKDSHSKKRGGKKTN